MTENPWVIVLAAGAGRRLASMTGGVPKQYWRYDGRRSLLEATLERTAPLSPAGRTLIVVDQSHQKYLDGLPSLTRRGRVIFQPRDRGTAAGVLLPLIDVIDADPNAIVLLTPSDQGIGRPDDFHAGIKCGLTAVQAGLTDAVLFGVEPDAALGDYGWISPDARRSGPLRRVAGFVEKPTTEEAARLLAAGGVWNTMVLVARAGVLLRLTDEHAPALANAFTSALGLRGDQREVFIAETYQTLQPVDFSHHVLTHARGLWMYTWPIAMQWSDLGTPKRLGEWMSAVA
jgi:mannose-1-phosphate guanylyltransferase